SSTVRSCSSTTPVGKTYGSRWSESRRMSHQSHASHAGHLGRVADRRTPRARRRASRVACPPPASAPAPAEPRLVRERGNLPMTLLHPVLQPVYDEVLHRNQGEHEFHQAVHEVLESLNPV